MIWDRVVGANKIPLLYLIGKSTKKRGFNELLDKVGTRINRNKKGQAFLGLGFLALIQHRLETRYCQRVRDNRYNVSTEAVPVVWVTDRPRLELSVIRDQRGLLEMISHIENGLTVGGTDKEDGRLRGIYQMQLASRQHSTLSVPLIKSPLKGIGEEHAHLLKFLYKDIVPRISDFVNCYRLKVSSVGFDG